MTGLGTGFGGAVSAKNASLVEAASPLQITQSSPNEPFTPEGTWTPGSGTTFTYTLSTTSFTLTVDVSLAFAPNLSSAGYFLYDPATGETQSFSASAVAIPGGARITGTNIPLITSGQDIQFFIFPTGGGAADFSPRYKIYRLMKLFMPYLQKPGLLEPDNTACTATSVPVGSGVSAQNDDLFDWFKFTLTAKGDYSVTLSSFTTPGYLEMWAGSDCNSLTLSQVFVLPPSSNPLVVKTSQNTGTYFFRVVSVTPDLATYSFSWVFAESKSELEPNNTACQATSLTPGTLYTGRDDDAQDWMKIELTGTARSTFTITNFAGSVGSFRVYSSTSANCAQLSASPIYSAALSGAQSLLNMPDLQAGTYYAVINNAGTLSQAQYTFVWSRAYTSVDLMEPNNTSCTAATLSLDRSYRTYAEDAEDWFVFTTPITGRIQIVFSNMPAASTSPLNTGTWLTIYRENGGCGPNQLTRVDLAAPDNVNPAITGNYQMAMSNQPPGKYYVFVNRLTTFNSTQPYQIRISQGDIGVWAPKVMSCPSQEFGCSKQSNGTVVMYYYGMMIGTQLSLRLGGLSCGTLCTGCPVGQSAPATSFTTVSESGVVTFTNVSTGYYGLYASANNPIFGTWGDEKPIKMECDFLLSTATENLFDLNLDFTR